MRTQHSYESAPAARSVSLGISLWPLLGALIATASAATAQDLVHKAAPQARPILLRGGTVHTVSGDVLERADLLFAEGVIQGIDVKGELASLVNNADVIDVAGKHIYPGFICVASTLGLTEVESVDMTLDTTEAGDVNSEVYASVAVNPDSWWLPVTRRNGVLTAGVMPQRGLVPGHVSVIRLDGWTNEDMTIERDAGLLVEWPFMGSARPRFGRRGGAGGASGEEALARLDALLDSGAAYLSARAADPTLPVDLRLAGLSATLRGERPVFVSATSREQIEAAVAWSLRRGIQIVLIGGRDALACADLLSRHEVMVALTAAHRLPHRRDLAAATTYELPVALEAAGVRWCMTLPASASSNARNLPYEAAACVPHGLSKAAALRSVTLSAAEALGVSARLGSLQKGKAATLFVADGDPFELSTQIEAAYIDGRRIALSDKQTELAAKYREKYRQLGLTR
ncbi:MAG: amidohydrolase family protein [Planctomycetota bacterium]